MLGHLADAGAEQLLLSHAEEAGGTTAAALAWTISAITGATIEVAKPETVTDLTWQWRLNAVLQPVGRILDHLDRKHQLTRSRGAFGSEALVLTPLDEQIIKRVNPDLMNRLRAAPFPPDPTRRPEPAEEEPRNGERDGPHR